MKTLTLKITLPSGNHAVYEIADNLLSKTPSGMVDTLKLRMYGKHISTRFVRDWFIFTQQKARSATKHESKDFESTPHVGDD